MKCRGTYALLAVVIALTACSARQASKPALAPPAPSPVAASATPTATPGPRRALLARRGDLLVAPAQIDGRAVGDFLLDTGAGATFVEQRLADELNLPVIVDVTTEGSPADAATSRREVQTLTTGGLSLDTTSTLAVDLSDASALVGGTVSGIIGFPTLGSAPFTLDFAHGSLTIHDPAELTPPANLTPAPLRLDQGLPFVEATLANGATVWLLLDSGASGGITLWHGFAKQYPGALTGPHEGLAPAPAGMTPVAASELISFRLFGEEYGRTPVVIQDAPVHVWKPRRVVGRVGMELLRRFRITIDPAARLIWAERL